MLFQEICLPTLFINRILFNMADSLRTKIVIDLEKANMIRQKYQTGHYTQTSLAREFGIGQDEISRIVNDKIWEGK